MTSRGPKLVLEPVRETRFRVGKQKRKTRFVNVPHAVIKATRTPHGESLGGTGGVNTGAFVCQVLPSRWGQR